MNFLISTSWYNFSSVSIVKAPSSEMMGSKSCILKRYFQLSFKGGFSGVASSQNIGEAHISTSLTHSGSHQTSLEMYNFNEKSWQACLDCKSPPSKFTVELLSQLVSNVTQVINLLLFQLVMGHCGISISHTRHTHTHQLDIVLISCCNLTFTNLGFYMLSWYINWVK